MTNVRAFSLVVVALLGARAAAAVETEKASECLLDFKQDSVGATDPCIPMATFAICLSKTAPGDKYAASAGAELEAAQTKTQGCDIKVTPSMTVVDRELRVVTNDDVKFERFRRDEVGVFELKEMIETNDASIEALKTDLDTGVKSLTEGLATQVADSKIAQDAATAAQVAFKAEVDGDVKVSLKAMETKVAGMEGTVNILKSSGGGCIPYVEYQTSAATDTAAAECKLLSYECTGGMFESVRPTRTTDRVCKKWTVQSCTSGTEYAQDGTSRTDSSCATATACKANEYELQPLTHNSDRVCMAAPAKCMETSSGLTTLFVDNKQIKTCCNGVKACGGDGKTKATAGKSCYTIKFVHKQTVSTKYWVFEHETANTAYEVFCEMEQCGWDKGGEWTDRSLCGGWSLVMKTSSGSTCLNRHKTNYWRSKKNMGDTRVLSEQCAKGNAYFRSSYSDVMLASTRKGRQNYNTAWRMPQSYHSLYDVINPCVRTSGGELIIPGYTKPTKKQKRQALLYMDWRSAMNTAGNDGRHYHDMCTNDSQEFGTFQKDSTSSGGSIAGCNSPGGNAGNVIGVGGDCGENCPRSYGRTGRTEYTRCISAWGFGGSYGNNNGGTGGQTVVGHWWGHGHSHTYVYGTAVFVRDKNDIKDFI